MKILIYHIGINLSMGRLRSEIVDWLLSKRRTINMVIGLIAILLYEVARVHYRPFIYANEVNDFHVADTLGNSLGTVATVFVLTSLLGHNSQQDHFLIRTVIISVLVYEMAHPLLGKSIDPWDMVATVIAGFFCEAIYRLIHKQPQSVSGNHNTAL